MALSTEYPLEHNIRATNENEKEEKAPSTGQDVFAYLSEILGYDLSGAIIAKYARLAVRGAELKQLQDGEFFAEIPDLRGVWARGSTRDEALRELKEVVEDWAHLKIQDADKDLPVVGGINLNVL